MESIAGLARMAIHASALIADPCVAKRAARPGVPNLSVFVGGLCPGVGDGVSNGGLWCRGLRLIAGVLGEGGDMPEGSIAMAGALLVSVQEQSEEAVNGFPMGSPGGEGMPKKVWRTG